MSGSVLSGEVIKLSCRYNISYTVIIYYNDNVSEKTAESDACRIEHIISESTFRGIKKFLKTLRAIFPTLSR